MSKNKMHELVESILEETKRQENQREEYLSLIRTLLESTERKDQECSRKLTFRRYSNLAGEERISFSSVITSRNNGTKCDLSQIEKAQVEMDRCVNYLVDCGDDVVEKFFEYITKTALPLFLQGRYPGDYKIK